MSSQQRIKRQMNHSVASTQQPSNPDVAALQFIGMRIRKAVADGYQVTQEQQPQQTQQFARPSLPAHLDAPPSLINGGSTAGSTSSMEEFDSYYKINNAPVMINTTYYENKYKRSFDAVDEVEIYHQKYGDLKFNEEF
ncbi:uncharacterized protein SPAPADRAFT_62530 [Spathaspora passalidarum NRRL Y-27907]|uniref:Damage-regulated import facilitator 1 n=1 Tax=Spathaspora passalidarum (strain NRRL Y-27907 / 11-Y1) TaxID=619300 RepID=G3ASC1_SPAPN|nr:uncharacterized protein SPAPADRAFT_62530 [Spathaspora passalidarum NRRL Y-27907]EGW30661.1 hypothetical protein SPAPADRAFT_62530 [Spathaspora passalidarum NRRL Y-27907]